MEEKVDSIATRFCRVEVGNQVKLQNELWKNSATFVVPESYISENVNTGVWEVLYPDPPFSQDRLEMIKDFVKRSVAILPNDCTKKECLILDHYNTYEEAIKQPAVRQNKLKTKPKPKASKPPKRKAGTTKRGTKRFKNDLSKLKPISDMVPKLRKAGVPDTDILSSQDTARTPITKSVSQANVPALGASNSHYQSEMGNVTSNSVNSAAEALASSVGGISSVQNKTTTDTNGALTAEGVKQSLFDVPSVSVILQSSDISTDKHLWSGPQALEILPSNFPTAINHSCPCGRMVMFPDLADFRKHLVTDVSKEISEIVQKSEKKITKRIDKIEKDLQSIEKAVLAQKPMQDLSNIVTYDDLKNKYGFKFPLTDYKEFQAFDLQVQNNYKEIKLNLTKYITSMLSITSDAKDKISIVLRKFVHNHVLILYTAQKPSPPKKKNRSPDNSAEDSIDDPVDDVSNEQLVQEDKRPIFKHTHFFQVFRDSFFRIYNTTEKGVLLTEGAILKAIGNMINSVKTTKQKSNSENVKINAA